MRCICSSGKDGVLLDILVQPKASRTRLVGLHDDRLKVAVASPPVDGKANKAIQVFLAKILSTARSDIVFKSGVQSRRKTVLVNNVSAAEVRALVSGLLNDL